MLHCCPPQTVGKPGTAIDIDGIKRRFTIIGEITQRQSTYPEKVLYLQKLQFEHDDRIELRLGYYIIAKKGNIEGKWVWGRFSAMMPVADLESLTRKAVDQGWLSV